MSDKSASQLGRLLRRHRARVSLSLEAAAAAAKLDKSTLSRLEQGLIESPDPQKLQRLANVLGTEVEDYYALAGYLSPTGLPGFAPYLRAKFDASPEVARDVEHYFNWRSAQTDEDGDQSKAA
jgi:transcriptional regulator with XRE-family HTH domain